ncbi:asparagine synthase (glutamine-hydrolyzing) [Pararhodospirillum oryzae]|uniref:asparagine synthase (glutamine-hydrolyzing) n=1 Tax=Pararhodospirillum oryzae TaxID=478448 RepID=A0A512H907_9PROT|nr:asparagine synthase (glutamine-hydrolyzing) [Pararhodospirillum oryzae]GEO81935.1 asparagine synthetase B [Pararhodospirillum oryzae]
MCGIAGLACLPGREPPEGLAARLIKALAHRGPDGSGLHEAPGVLLVQTRLAIVDLVSGDQPLIDDAGRVLVANGEIYNDPLLRQMLGETRFRTHSDCEPILPLYADHGVDGAGALRGMVAFALWDPGPRRLVLHRDPFGIKPLYIAETPWGVAFASEPQALIAARLVDAVENPGPRDQLLQLQFTCGTETAFAGIHRVAPGELLVIEDGRIVARHHREALPPTPTPLVTPKDPLAELDRVLADSVAVHQRADVPYGLFLSGGIDSCAVLALMARLGDRPVLAFTASFPEGGAPDEAEPARDAARAVGARHVVVPVRERDFLDHLPAMVAALDDPVADYAIVPTWLLARAARTEVKVVLCGEGGDEMLGGYGRYRHARRPWPFGRPLRRTGLLEGLGVLRAQSRAWRQGIAGAEARARALGGSRLIQAQRVDCADWLPHDLLNKLDRCLMAHGVEGRVPFVDPEVAAFCLPLADDLKIRGGRGKWLLRAWLDRHLPATNAFAPKQGFTVPVGQWIHAHGPRLGALVAAVPAVQALAEPQAVRALFESPRKDAALGAWVLLSYALWHRRHVGGLAPEGDVFHCLATPG